MRQLSVATVRLQEAALGVIHRSSGYQVPTAHEGVKRVLAGIARSRGNAQRQTKRLTAEAYWIFP